MERNWRDKEEFFSGLCDWISVASEVCGVVLCSVV